VPSLLLLSILVLFKLGKILAKSFLWNSQSGGSKYLAGRLERTYSARPEHQSHIGGHKADQAIALEEEKFAIAQTTMQAPATRFARCRYRGGNGKKCRLKPGISLSTSETARLDVRRCWSFSTPGGRTLRFTLLFKVLKRH